MDQPTIDIEFLEFPKMARLRRECIVTEKIDGTNAQVCIGPNGEFRVGSRTGWITPERDNHGFAAWAYAHKDELLQLGPGRHFGEWWGGKIQRTYGLAPDDKRFSLFNVQRWALHGTEPQVIPTADPRVVKVQDVLPACCGLVPVLYRGLYADGVVEAALEELRREGSRAVPGFMRPEGVVCYHVAGNVGFKVTLEKDEEPKGFRAPKDRKEVARA